MAVERVSKRLKKWDEDKNKVVNLMPGYIEEQSNPITLNLLGSSTINSSSSSSSCGLESIESESIEGDMLDLGQAQCLPPGSDKCLDLKTGEVYYPNSGGENALSSMVFPAKEISTEGGDKRVHLELNLSTSNALNSRRENSVSCINDCSDDNSVSENESAMRLIGCLTCLTYYMVCRGGGGCPKCKGSSLLDFVGGAL